MVKFVKMFKSLKGLCFFLCQTRIKVEWVVNFDQRWNFSEHSVKKSGNNCFLTCLLLFLCLLSQLNLAKKLT